MVVFCEEFVHDPLEPRLGLEEAGESWQDEKQAPFWLTSDVRKLSLKQRNEFVHAVVREGLEDATPRRRESSACKQIPEASHIESPRRDQRRITGHHARGGGSNTVSR